MSFNPILRPIILIGAPIVLGALELTHPFIGPYSDITDSIFPIAAWWTTIHVLQIALFAALAAAIFILLSGIRGRAATIARFCAIAFGVIYPSFDSAVGIGSGVIVSAAPDPTSVELEKALHPLFWGPVTGMLDLVAAVCWLLATTITGVLLRRNGAPIAVTVLLVISGVALATGHVPPFGPIACFAFAAAAAIIEFRDTSTAGAA